MSDWAGSPARLALQALPSAVIVYNPQHRLVMVNQRMLDLTGADQRWLAPNTPLSDVLVLFMMRGLFGEGDPVAQLAEFTRLDRSKPSRRVLRLTDGTTLEARVQPMADGGFIECFTDMTAFTGPLETTRQDLRRLEEVFNQLSLGVAVFKQDELLLFNPAYPKLTGLPANQARPGLTAHELNDMQSARGEFTPEQREEWEAQRAARVPGKRSSTERRRPNGTALRLDTYPLADNTTLYEFSDVTAERRAQEEAQRRALLLDIVLAALPVGVAVYGPDMRVRLINAAYNTIYTGYQVKIGDNLATVLRARAEAGLYGPGDPEELVRNLLPRTQRPDAALRRRPDGRMISLTGKPLPDGGRVIVVSDVTALHEAEAQARAQAETLRSMLEGMRHGITLFDGENRLVAANKLAAAMCGLPADVMVPGATLADLAHVQIDGGEYDEATQALYFVASAKLPEAPPRYTRTRPDGSIIEVRTDQVPSGGFVRTYSDITELRRAQDQLSTMLEGMRHGIALFDAEHRLVATNRAIARMLNIPEWLLQPGTPYAEMVDQMRQMGLLGADQASVDVVLAKLFSDLRQPTRYFCPKPYGRMLEAVRDPLPDGGFILTYLEVSIERLAQDTAPSAISPALDAPLSTIIGLAQALQAEPHAPARAEQLQSLRAAGEQFLAAIDQMLQAAPTAPSHQAG
jgi:PAS domain-containing protein